MTFWFGAAQDYIFLAQKEMLVGGQAVSEPLRVRMEMLSRFAASLAEQVRTRLCTPVHAVVAAQIRRVMAFPVMFSTHAM